MRTGDRLERQCCESGERFAHPQMNFMQSCKRVSSKASLIGYEFDANLLITLDAPNRFQQQVRRCQCEISVLMYGRGTPGPVQANESTCTCHQCCVSTPCRPPMSPVSSTVTPPCRVRSLQFFLGQHQLACSCRCRRRHTRRRSLFWLMRQTSRHSSRGQCARQRRTPQRPLSIHLCALWDMRRQRRPAITRL